jgi:aspartate oxidase
MALFYYIFMRNVDFLIVGSGIAGLSFALKAAQYGKVLIVTKASEDESNTKYAQGGVAVVVDKEEDSFDKHIDDTLIAGETGTAIAGEFNSNAVFAVALESSNDTGVKIIEALVL